MSILKISQKPTAKELKLLAQEFKTYVKLVVDVKRKIIYGGCKLHADAEKILIKEGSQQKDIWGGGIDLETGEIDVFAIINIRPVDNNPSQEILDKDIREKFINLVKKYFNDK